MVCSEWNISVWHTVQNIPYICTHACTPLWKDKDILLQCRVYYQLRCVLSHAFSLCVWFKHTHTHAHTHAGRKHTHTHTWLPARHCVLILPGTCKSASLKKDCSLIPSVQHGPQWPSHTLTHSLSDFVSTFTLTVCTTSSVSFTHRLVVLKLFYPMSNTIFKEPPCWSIYFL